MVVNGYLDKGIDHIKIFDRWSDRHYYVKGHPKWLNTMGDHLILEISLLGIALNSANTGRMDPETLIFPTLSLAADALKNKLLDYHSQHFSPDLYEATK